MDKKILLTIGMIVKNEEEVLERCLKSLMPIMEAISCELIITDTGSTDKTVEIAKKYTDNILYFEWCNNFAKARNTGWYAAKGEWFLYIDADEYFIDAKEFIDFFTSNQAQKYNSIYLGIRSIRQDGLYANSFSYRCTRTANKANCFVGEVHEALPYIDPVKSMPVILEHTGYDFTDKTLLKRKSERNIPILLEMYKENPNRYNVYFQLFYEYDSAEMFDKAIEIAKKGEEYEKKTENRKCSVFFTNCQIRIHFKNEEYALVIQLGEALFAFNPPPDIGMIDVYAMMGVAYYYSGMYELSISHCKKYFEYLKQYREKKLQRSINSLMPVVFYDADFYYHQFNMFIALSYIKLNNYKLAFDYAKKINLYEAKLIEVKGYELKLNIANELKKPDLVLEEYNLIAHPSIDLKKYRAFFKACENYIMTDKEKYNYFVNYFANAKYDSPYFQLNKLRCHYKNNNVDEAVKILKWFEENTEDISEYFSDIIYIAYKLNYNLKNILSKLTLEKTRMLLDRLIELNKDKLLTYNPETPEIAEYFSKENYSNSIEMMYCALTLTENYITSFGYIPNEDNLDIYYDFINNLYIYTANIYHEELLCPENIHHVPGVYRFAYYAYNAMLCKNSNDLKGFMNYTKLAVAEKSSIKKVMDVIISNYENERLKTNTKEQEFSMYAEKLIKQAKQFIDSKNFDMAKEIVVGLDKLLPNDSRVVELKEKLKIN